MFWILLSKPSCMHARHCFCIYIRYRPLPPSLSNIDLHLLTFNQGTNHGVNFDDDRGLTKTFREWYFYVEKLLTHRLITSNGNELSNTWKIIVCICPTSKLLEDGNHMSTTPSKEAESSETSKAEIILQTRLNWENLFNKLHQNAKKLYYLCLSVKDAKPN